MKKVRNRTPSFSTVIALMALFVALGGTSYGLARNSIDSRELKNNDVRSRDLRNNDVRGRDIRGNTLTGSDVLESSLGTVPRATTATTATNAARATNASIADNATSLGGVAAGGYVTGGGSLRRVRLALNDGQTGQGLLSIPGVGSFTAGCTNSADTITTAFVNQSGGRVVRIHGERLSATTAVTGGSLNNGESTNRSTTEAGSNRAHIHTYEVAPADGPGAIAHVRIAAVSSATGDARCVFSASGIAG